VPNHTRYFIGNEKLTYKISNTVSRKEATFYVALIFIFYFFMLKIDLIQNYLCT